MAGIMDMVLGDAANKDSGSGGLGGFFDSPIASILMPRTAARFQEMKKQNFLMEQIQRKNEFAFKFAASIKDKDPQSAAMIMSDPSTIDNYLQWQHQDQSWRDQNAVTQQSWLDQNAVTQQQLKDEEIRKAGIARQAEIAKLNDPGGIGAYQKKELGLLDTGILGKMVDPRIQGPRPADAYQQGQTIKDATPEMILHGMRKATNIPDLSLQEATDIAIDPNAIEKIRTAREISRGNTLTATSQTVTVRNPETGEEMVLGRDANGGYTVPIGSKPLSDAEKTVARDADARVLASRKANGFFGEDASTPASRTQKWRDYYKDPTITETDEARLTSAFAGALSGDNTPTNAEALAKVTDEYNRIRPTAAKTQEVINVDDLYTKGSVKNFTEKTGPDITTAGRAAVPNAANIALLKSALAGAPQGWGEPGAYIASFVPGYSGATDTVQSIINSIIPSIHAPGSGSQSDLEFNSAKMSLPQLMKSREGNAVIVSMLEAKNKLLIERSDIVQQLDAGDITYKDAMRKLREVDKRSIITPEMTVLMEKAGFTMDLDASARDIGKAGDGLNNMPITNAAKAAGLTDNDWLYATPDEIKQFADPAKE